VSRTTPAMVACALARAGSRTIKARTNPLSLRMELFPPYSEADAAGERMARQYRQIPEAPVIPKRW
jgi:hypothetical protein